MKIDFAKFAGTIPYSSELYGIYQPLLGWKSRRIRSRFELGLTEYRRSVLESLLPRLEPRFTVQGIQPEQLQFAVQRAAPTVSPTGPLLWNLDSVVGRRVAELIASNGVDDP